VFCRRLAIAARNEQLQQGQLRAYAEKITMPHTDATLVRSSADAPLADNARPTAPDASKSDTRRAAAEALMQVRASDVQPYTGLGYLSKLFRIIAIFLVLLLLLEVVTGLYREGIGSLPTLLSEVSRLVVLAGLLWGAGDLANLLIDVGHDVRAARILLGRAVAHGGLPAASERSASAPGERSAAPSATTAPHAADTGSQL
jgi:hypothetical protein